MERRVRTIGQSSFLRKAVLGIVFFCFLTGVTLVTEAQTLSNSPRDFWIDKEENLIYLLRGDNQTVDVIDLASHKITASVNLSSPLPVGTVFLDETGQWLVFLAHGIARDGLISILPKKKLVSEDRLRYTVTFPITSGFPLIAQKGGKLYLASTLDKRLRVFLLGEEPTELPSIALEENANLLKADPAKDIIYILHKGINRVSVVDSKTDSIIKTFQIGGQSISLVVDPNNDRLFLSSSAEGTVYVLNRTTYALEKKISVGNLPGFMTILSKVDKVFVANNADGTLAVIDKTLSTQTIDLKSPASLTSASYFLSVDTVRNRVYATNLLTNMLFSIDGERNTLVNQIKVGADPTLVQVNEKSGNIYFISRGLSSLAEIKADTFDLVLLPAEQRQLPDTFWFNRPQGIVGDETAGVIYVTNFGNGTITAIDIKSNKPIKKIPTGFVSEVIVLNKNTKKLYASNREESSVTVIDTKTGQVGKIPVGKTPRSLYVKQDRNKIYVANFGDKTLSVIDGSTDQVTNTIPIDRAPLAPAASHKKLFVSNSGAGSITIIDLDAEKVEKSIEVGGNPGWIIPYLPLKEMYAVVEGNRTLVVLNSETGEIKKTINLNFTPYRAIAFRNSNILYIIHRGDPKVTKIDLITKDFIGEEIIPFFGYLDLNYNMFWSNPETGLTYFTSRANNFIKVVAGGIEDPRLIATILPDGTIILAGARSEIGFLDRNKNLIIGIAGIFMLAVVAFLIRRLGIWFRVPS